jgi:hypothetical protein
MRLELKLFYALIAVLSFLGCNKPRASEPLQNSADSGVDYSDKIEKFVTKAQGIFTGKFERGLIFRKSMTVDVLLEKLKNPDSQGRVARMTISVEGKYKCTANARVGVDNDAYKIDGKHSATVEISQPYLLSQGKCPFSVVLALPENFEGENSKAMLALTMTNDLSSREVFTGSLSKSLPEVELRLNSSGH